MSSGKPRRVRTAYQRRAEPALHKSIAHWDRLATGTQGANERVGAVDCECCTVFDMKGNEESCKNCPVKLRSGRRGCSGTPYEDVSNIMVGRMYSVEQLRADHRFKEAAAIEREYLKETLELVKLGTVAPGKPPATGRPR